MPPNLEVQIPKEDFEVDDHITVILTPISDSSASSADTDFITEEFSSLDISIPDDQSVYPLGLEQNFREFLINQTNTEELSTVTQIKLRVISTEVPLQYLSLYTPALRELILDGSALWSLRDIGGGLKNLKILRVNRCGLTCIDGVFNIECLEELYAADNEITSLAPCAFLANLRVLDVQRNNVVMKNISYLGFCGDIEELWVGGNPGVVLNSSVAVYLQKMLPRLRSLDGVLVTDLINNADEESDDYFVAHNNNTNDHQEQSFTVNFPPRVVLHRYFYNQ